MLESFSSFLKPKQEKKSEELFSSEEYEHIEAEVEKLIAELPPEELEKRERGSSQMWKSDELESLIATMDSFARAIGPHLHEYAGILGDDSSGRLPAHFVWHMTKLLQKKESEEGAMPLRFMAVPGELRYAREEDFATHPALVAMTDHIKDLDIKGRLLVVTEYIYTGLTTRALARAAVEAGNEADIAAVSVESVDVALPSGVRVFRGTEGREGRSLFEFTRETDRGHLTGVTKKEDLPSSRMVQSKEPVIFAEANDKAEQPLMKVGRNIMKYLAEECAKKLEARLQKKSPEINTASASAIDKNTRTKNRRTNTSRGGNK